MAKEIVLTDREQEFIDLVIEYDGDVRQAAIDSGYHPGYAYKLRNRLAKHISEAAQQYIAINSAKVAKKLVDEVDAVIPNSARIMAMNSVLDRAGVKPMVDHEEVAVVKANIFILPEKKYIDIEHE